MAASFSLKVLTMLGQEFSKPILDSHGEVSFYFLIFRFSPSRQELVAPHEKYRCEFEEGVKVLLSNLSVHSKLSLPHNCNLRNDAVRLEHKPGSQPSVTDRAYFFSLGVPQARYQKFGKESGVLLLALSCVCN